MLLILVQYFNWYKKCTIYNINYSVRTLNYILHVSKAGKGRGFRRKKKAAEFQGTNRVLDVQPLDLKEGGRDRNQEDVEVNLVSEENNLEVVEIPSQVQLQKQEVEIRTGKILETNVKDETSPGVEEGSSRIQERYRIQGITNEEKEIDPGAIGIHAGAKRRTIETTDRVLGVRGKSPDTSELCSSEKISPLKVSRNLVVYENPKRREEDPRFVEHEHIDFEVNADFIEKIQRGPKSETSIQDEPKIRPHVKPRLKLNQTLEIMDPMHLQEINYSLAAEQNNRTEIVQRIDKDASKEENLPCKDDHENDKNPAVDERFRWADTSPSPIPAPRSVYIKPIGKFILSNKRSQ